MTYKEYCKHIEKVFRSCKTKEHVEITAIWAMKAKYGIKDMSHIQLVFLSDPKWFADIQMEYIEKRLNGQLR